MTGTVAVKLVTPAGMVMVPLPLLVTPPLSVTLADPVR